MISEYQFRLSPEIASDLKKLKSYISKNKKIDVSRIYALKIIKKSIDARQRNIVVNVKVRAWVDEKPSSESLINPISYQNVKDKSPVIVVGAGPAGLFAALRLIELGLKPIIFERGKNVDERRLDLARISREGIIDENSNYCFGEGGAGAYSDGKLYTRSKKRGNVEKILSILHQHGAPEDILVDAHPHIGTDKLPVVIKNIRQTIINSGGEVHFKSRVKDLLLENNEIIGVTLDDNSMHNGPIILATGHSARDVYNLLCEKNIDLELKGIAVGVRLEHPQKIIDQIQYHNPSGRGEYLPPAEYTFSTQVDGRGVYSFCMCPGGVVVPAASGPNQLVVNGMSPSNRGTYWANSGMVVEIRPEDVEDKTNSGVLKMMKFQEELEEICFNAAGKTQVAGAQRMKDFVGGKPSKLIPPSSYPPGLQTSRIDEWLPPFISKRLQKGFKSFGKYAPGFLTNNAIVIGVETRTSSPVRIPRNSETLEHIRIEGLFPSGEGAGYAGGIVSAAIDGENSAEAVYNKKFK